MFNTSVVNISPLSGSNCDNGIYVGMFVFFIVVPVCFLLGTPARLWLLWLFLHAAWKMKPTQVFPLNMTILELIYSIESVAEVLNLLVIYSEMLWRIIYSVFSLAWVGIPLMQTCVCLEHYLAVIHPIIFLKYKGVQYRVVCAAVVWMMAAGHAGYVMFTGNMLLPVFNTVFFISVTVVSFCCVSVLFTLKHSGPGDTQIPMERGRDVGNQQKRKAFNTIFSGLLIILFTYLPQVTGTILTVSALVVKSDFCNTSPLLISFNTIGVMIMTFMRMYKNGGMKCLTH